MQFVRYATIFRVTDGGSTSSQRTIILIFTAMRTPDLKNSHEFISLEIYYYIC